MSKVQKLIAAEHTTFSPYSNLPSTAISRIASKCQRDEVAETHIRIKNLNAELATVPDWDGDTQDDIWRAIELFRAILAKVR